MKIVAIIDGSRMELTGKTQVIETIVAENPLYESRVRRELKHPPAIGGTFYPEPDTALAFLALMASPRNITSRKVEVIECLDVDTIPYEEGVVY